jgi:hypothetical protein
VPLDPPVRMTRMTAVPLVSRTVKFGISKRSRPAPGSTVVSLSAELFDVDGSRTALPA